MKEKGLNIVKASAGSGKTFTLAKEYIRLLLENYSASEGSPYRHILAVTFTNKATAEMKGRILKELDILASAPKSSKYLEALVEETGRSAQEISAMSRKMLCGILNDYGAFSVSTIDTFFQRTLKAFSREIGQFASYQVELDRKSLINESVDRILDSITENDRDLLKWLTDSVKYNLSVGKKYDIGSGLYEMATALKSEEHRDVVEKSGIDEAAMYSKGALSALKKKCDSIIDAYLSEVRARASVVVQGFGDAGVSLSNTSRGVLKPLAEYAVAKVLSDFPDKDDSFFSKISDKENWFAKKNEKLLPLVGHLENAMREFCALFGERYKECNTAVMVRDQIFSLGLYAEIKASFEALMKEKNVLCLDDSNTILKGIIDGSDAPFIYEKLGVRYDSFLLDEFQDTSRIQWENFLPLLKNSVASGNRDLVVGDVKQSIYRWRNSDWNLLNTEIQAEFKDGSDVVTLNDNWRSTREVVNFNNDFYAFAAKELDSLAGTGEIKSIYADVRQTPKAAEEACGNVNVFFCSGRFDEGKQAQLQVVLEEVDRLKSSGAWNSDICILVRTNADGALVAEALLEKGIPVISDEALSVKSSLAVRRLVALMSYANNPGDRLNSFLASSLGIEAPGEWHSLVDLCEYFIREMKSSLNTEFDGEVPYLQAFMDELQDWTKINGNVLGEFLDYWEGIDPKISSPDGVDAVEIMTVHKSKGLEPNYVIFPFAECALYSKDDHWCRPEVSGTELEGLDGIYRVNLSSKAEKSYFGDAYSAERKMQMVDALNVYYVATTRAKKGMTIITSMPSKEFKDGAPYGKMSDLLYDYVLRDKTGAGFKSIPAHPDNDGVPYSGEDEGFMKGEPYQFHHDGGVTSDVNAVGYSSYLLNPEEGEPRLRFSTASQDFFSEDGTTGFEASGRLKGIVLHDIMSRVIVPDDLAGAVEESFGDGSIDLKEKEEILELLADRIGSAEERGWFPDDRSKVLTETSVIGADGEIHRPDRVIVDGGKVVVVDYKFGAEEKAYFRQVRRYAELYRAMGYSDVEAYLWYVEENNVVKA